MQFGGTARKSIRYSIFVGVLAGSAFAGSGAFADIPITSQTDLIMIGNSEAKPLSGNYFLANSFEITEPIEEATYIENTFTGTFDGKGNTIFNLAKPLFDILDGRSSEVVIKNLVLKTTESTPPEINSNEFSLSSTGIGGLTGQGVLANQIYNSQLSDIQAVGQVTSSNLLPVGGLAGSVESSNLEQVSFTGSVISHGSPAGGLLGTATSSTITDAQTLNRTNTTDVLVGTDFIGGLIGISTSSNLDRTYSELNILGNNFVGGLVGRNIVDADLKPYLNPDCTNSECALAENISVSIGNISNSVSNGNVLATGGIVGGLVGENDIDVQLGNRAKYTSMFGNVEVGNITVSYATGEVRSNVGNYLGGLVGFNHGSFTLGDFSNFSTFTSEAKVGVIENSYATGNVFSPGDYIGGLIGAEDYSKNILPSATWSTTSDTNQIGDVFKSWSTGLVDGGNYVGGLIGSSSGDVSNSYSNINGDVTGSGNYVGGLIGSSSGDVSNSYSNINGDVTGSGNYVGGHIGSSSGDVSNSYSNINGDVSGSGYAVGGFVGSATAEISNAYSHVARDVLGQQYLVGGFIGSAQGEIKNSFGFTGRDVRGDQDFVGGFAGNTSGKITNSHAQISRDVIGKRNYVGGFAGGASSDLIDSGTIIGRDLQGGYEEPVNSYNYGEYVGGLVGYLSQADVFETYVQVGRNVYGSYKVGGLVGIVENIPDRKEIKNSVVEIRGDISTTGNFIGGLIGYSANAFLNNSDLTIYGNLNSSILSSLYVGGLVGYFANSKMSNSDGYIKGNIIAKDLIGGLAGFTISRFGLDDGIQGSFLVLDGELLNDVNMVPSKVNLIVGENYFNYTTISDSESMVWDVANLPDTPNVLQTLNSPNLPISPQFEANSCRNNGRPFLRSLISSYVNICPDTIKPSSTFKNRIQRETAETRTSSRIEKPVGFKNETPLPKTAPLAFVDSTEKIDLTKVKAVEIAPTANVKVVAKAGEALQISLKSESKEPVELWVKSPDGSWLLAGVITFDENGKAILPPLQFKNAGDYSLVLSKPSADSSKGSAPLNQTGSLLVSVS